MQQVPEPVPQRIGDAERDASIERLRAAMSEGRITAQEFDERMTAALQARTQNDLDPLFVDLPPIEANPKALAIPAWSPAGPTELASPPRQSAEAEPAAGLPSRLQHLYWLVWPLTIWAAGALGWGNFWWLIFIPIFVLPALIGQSRSSLRYGRQRRRDEWRQLRR